MSSVRIASIVLVASCALSAAMGQSGGRLQAVPFTDVQIEDAFWKPKLDTIRKATLPHCFEQCAQTGRIANFDKAAGIQTGEHEGACYNDSDVYKVIEGAAYALMSGRDAKLEATVDDLVDRIAAAQRKNGYLNTYYELTPDETPFSDLRGHHELYCAGHLLEAGIAYYRATGKRKLLDVAQRFVDHIATVFGPDKRHDVPGHEELELALIKLYRLSGKRKYLDLARFFVEQRGRADGRKLYGQYCQDHRPVRAQTQIVGHAVRAMYLLSAVTDLAAISPDAGYERMLDRVWRDTVYTRLYITGGIGPSSHNEGFTVPYDLPNDTAYCETCAAIALCLWNARMNLLRADARYVDVFERALYNGLLSGVSLDGTRFFYTNPLGSTGDHHRQPWFTCACCPTNIVRFLPSLGGYVYARDDDGVYVNLYIGGTARIELADGKRVAIRQQTNYPWDGRVRLHVRPPTPTTFTLALRIPGWCRGARLAINDRPVRHLRLARGYVRIRRTWQPGDLVELNLPMPILRMEADPRVRADRGRVALQRGPIVFCLEAADNQADVRRVVLPPGAELAERFEPRLLGGVMTIHARGSVAPLDDGGWDGPLYRPEPPGTPADLLAIPYFAWDNREPGAMVVWLPEAPTVLKPGPVAWVRPSASHCYAGDTLAALCDRVEPTDSRGHGIPRFTWWPRRGTTEWVQYDFVSPRRVSRVAVYWFDDSADGGGCRPPKSWKLLYRAGDTWREVPHAAGLGVKPNQYNVTAFDPLTASGLRIEARLRAGYSAGILEWKVSAGR